VRRSLLKKSGELGRSREKGVETSLYKGKEEKTVEGSGRKRGVCPH